MVWCLAAAVYKKSTANLETTLINMTYFATAEHTEHQQKRFFIFIDCQRLPANNGYLNLNFQLRARATHHSPHFREAQMSGPNNRVLDFSFFCLFFQWPQELSKLIRFFVDGNGGKTRQFCRCPVATPSNVKYATWTSASRETEFSRHEAGKSFGRFSRDAWAWASWAIHSQRMSGKVNFGIRINISGLKPTMEKSMRAFSLLLAHDSTHWLTSFLYYFFSLPFARLNTGKRTEKKKKRRRKEESVASLINTSVVPCRGMTGFTFVRNP